jgi:DNA mismatch repair ATPase MutS
VSFLESSSSKWETGEFNNENELYKEIYKLSPKEIILEKELFKKDEFKKNLEKKYCLNIYSFSSKNNAKQNLEKHFNTKNLE